MVTSTEKLKKRESSISYTRKNSLMLSIDNNDNIIKFNDGCKQVTGYRIDEAINKNFLDFLIPSRYFNQWKGVFNSSRKNKMIEDFKLPILTHNGHEIMISWSSFPIKNSADVVSDIDFVGTFIDSWDDSEVSLVKLSKDVVESKVDAGGSGEAFLRLLKSNEDLKRKNQKLEKNITALKSRRGKKDAPVSYSGKLVYSLADVVGGKKRRQEFERMMNELDVREKKINKLESQLLKDKKKVNEMRDEFSEWREKLEILESEIQKRNMDLEDRAKLLDSTIDLGKSIGVVSTDLSKELSSVKIDTKEVNSEDLLNNISFCAAVIQRGILKQVNGSFANLIGYNAEDIVEKSFFDFIAPEGLLGLEKYYLDRLKGGKVNSYDTVFLNSDDQTVRMKVRIKSTVFNGDKVEVAVFTKPEDIVDESEIFGFIETQQEKVAYEDVEEQFDEMEETVETVEEEDLEPDTLTETELPTEEPQTEIEDESGPEATKEETLLVSEETTEDADEEKQIAETEEPKTESEPEAKTNEEEPQPETEVIEDDGPEVEAEPETKEKETLKEETETEDEKTDTESTKKTENKQKEEDK